ncbi:MAG: excinuclease ABC subunit UvrA [Gammaproteobacteria bacterium]|nr:excinuclease ABC subunit UvrA [Gammaproteobacteria bacterium]
MSTKIKIEGARTHNLKNITLDIPRDNFVILTGVSGSGKSSLAFDTLYAEGQRRYVESLSSYARQFLSMMDKPDVDRIEGLSPAIAIEQKTTSHNPRSTVGTVTEIYDYLRVLFARVGTPYCPTHHTPLRSQTVDQMAQSLTHDALENRIIISAPLVRGRKGSHEPLFDKMQGLGFSKVVWNGSLSSFDELTELDPKKNHNIDMVIDRLRITHDENDRLRESLETAVKYGEGLVKIYFLNEQNQISDERILSASHGCVECGFSLPMLEPKFFSFNSPLGSCPTCDGLGFDQQIDVERLVQPLHTLSQGAIAFFSKNEVVNFELLKQICEHYQIDMDTPFNELTEKSQQILLWGDLTKKSILITSYYYKHAKPKKMVWKGAVALLQERYRETDQESVKESLQPFIQYAACRSCDGIRLRPEYRAVRVGALKIEDFTQVSIMESYAALQQLVLTPMEQQIAQPLLDELKTRLSFLLNVGLDYLSLARSAETLSGGESQRIRLASQIGSKLVGVMYVLDEPSIGLHQRDNDRLIATMRSLTEIGNTVIVVEHDEEAILAADYVIDLGPGAGVFGGEVLAKGTPQEIMKNTHSVTGRYLSGHRRISHPGQCFHANDYLTLHEASCHNLKNVSVRIPVGLLTCITGVSGSGKSSLINHTLVPYITAKIARRSVSRAIQLKNATGVEHFSDLICVDQSPIGRTPRSNPATYTGLLTPIREFFAKLPKSQSLGFTPGRFSFNVPGGRCEKCSGDGVLKVEMHFLSDIYVPCEACHGKRYNQQTLEVTYKGQNIADVLNMTVQQAAELFSAFPAIARKLDTLIQVGLGYIKLGQSATTLSGGEAQRVKLSKELSKRGTAGRTLYILDEPTTGLHFEDIQRLLEIIFALRDRGNTICIIEHNLDVVDCADWIIDLGPEGGSRGGSVLYEGPRADFEAASDRSITAEFLRKMKSDRHQRWTQYSGEKI